MIIEGEEFPKRRSRFRRSQATVLPSPGARALAIVLPLALLLTACKAERSEPTGMYLLQKGPYQAFYGESGRLERLLQDQNGDGRAEAITLFDDEGRPTATEIDSDGDGVVDRWQRYSPAGGLKRLETSRHRRGAPDVWEDLDESGRLVKREVDEDGDGTPDRTEPVAPGAPRRLELDPDAEGRPHRWEVYEGARLAAEELDTDGDAKPDRRLVRGALGELVRMEKLEQGRWIELAVGPR